MQLLGHVPHERRPDDRVAEPFAGTGIEGELLGDHLVVSFSSTAAFFAHPFMAAYSAGKGGIFSFTHSIAQEHGKRGSRAENVVPGDFPGPEKVAGVVAMVRPCRHPGALWGSRAPAEPDGVRDGLQYERDACGDGPGRIAATRNPSMPQVPSIDQRRCRSWTVFQFP